MSAFLCRASATHHLLERQQQVKQELELDGKFELSFELLHAQDVFFYVGNTQFSLLLELGDTLELTWLYEKKKMNNYR